MKAYTLHEPTFTPRIVSIPDECPACKADLTQPNALRVWEWSSALCALSNLHEFAIEPLGSTNFESTYSESISCGACTLQFGAKP